MGKKIKKYIDWDTISRVKEGQASDEEKRQVETWLSERESHSEFLEGVEQYFALAEKDELPEVNVDDAIEKFNTYTEKEQSRKIQFSNLLKYAAVIAIPLLLAVSLFYFSSDTGEWFVEDNLNIKAGYAKAELVLSNGDKVNLDKNNKLQIEEKGVKIQADSNLLSYSYNNKVKDEIFNTIIIPKGGEYQLTLSDGTKVWLNSESSLKYPVNFTRDQRSVILTGEAYFDVAHDKKKPFKVKVSDLNVKVLGTSFNIKAYSDENLIQTTLVEGKVEVQTKTDAGISNSLLVPNRQAIYSKKEKEIQVIDVDPYEFIAWKDGRFVLNKMSLIDISDVLSRWYDVEFFFVDEQLKYKTFTGRMRKYDNLDDILDLIDDIVDVNFEIGKKSVVVSVKN